MCDGEDDCGDGFDEMNCKCDASHGKFLCKSGISRDCIDLSLKCNGVTDCDDFSDEEGCPNCLTHQCNINNVSTCIEERHVCNKSVNCDNLADEKLCGVNECALKTDKCEQVCIDTKQSYKCACRDAYHLSTDGYSCVHTCKDYSKHKCSQICIPGTGKNQSHVCECASGYTLESDGVSCKHSSKRRPYLLVTNKQYINKVSVNRESGFYEFLYNNEKYGNVVSMDFDWSTQRLFWLETGGILSFSNISRPGRKTLLKHDIPKPLDVTVDWVNHNIYFTEASQFNIYVIDMKSKQKRTILTDKTRPPNTLICHPKSGFIYYTTRKTKANATISRVGMDGTKPRVFFDKDLRNPQGLAFDYVTDTLYWSDVHTKKIQYISLSNPEVSRFLLHTPGASFGLSVFENFIYFSTIGPEGALYKAHRWTGEDRTVIRKAKSFEKYTGVRVTFRSSLSRSNTLRLSSMQYGLF